MAAAALHPLLSLPFHHIDLGSCGPEGSPRWPFWQSQKKSAFDIKPY